MYFLGVDIQGGVAKIIVVREILQNKPNLVLYLEYKII
jgi:hypothetical protein